jgi:hypothetical protein
MRISYTALEVLLSLFGMVNIDHSKEPVLGCQHGQNFEIRRPQASLCNDHHAFEIRAHCHNLQVLQQPPLTLEESVKNAATRFPSSLANRCRVS